MARFTVSGREFELQPVEVERCLAEQLPDPLQLHYVVVGGRRFPPKQALACATGLDRADFTTHQARRILRRLGFVAARLEPLDQTGPAGEADDQVDTAAAGPHGGSQADALRPYRGQWVALAGPTEVLVAAETPQQLLAWLAQHARQAPYGMFRVPATVAEAEGAAPA